MVQHFAKMILHIQLKKFKVVVFFFKTCIQNILASKDFLLFLQWKITKISNGLKKT